ncbi:MAG TPA: T9SS type A sorting domain-containing protein [Bacteroidia bacterium]|nr:T9SS type A sorting domain-containing protein [Bacteroidia bacterium]
MRIMKQVIIFFNLIFFCNVNFNFCSAQIIYKGLNNDNSTFLLGAVNARKSQCLYKPSDFNSVPASGLINKIYYRYGTTGITTAHDLSPFTVKIGQTIDSVFSGGNTFYTGLTTVRYDSVFTIPAGVQGDWLGIELQTPFIYDSTKTLIVEIQFYSSTGTAFGTLGNSNNNQKIISSDTASLVSVGSSTTWQDFGFDYLISTGNKLFTSTKNFNLFPNPSADIVNISGFNVTEVSVFDATGNQVLHQFNQNLSENLLINLQQFANGIYFIKVVSNGNIEIKKVSKI